MYISPTIHTVLHLYGLGSPESFDHCIETELHDHNPNNQSPMYDDPVGCACRPPQDIKGIFLSGWQFKNRIVLRSCSLPASILGSLEREYGRPPVGEEVYGPPSTPELLRLRNGLLAAPNRLATVTTALLKREEFDVVWITASAAHLAGHRFLKMSQVSGAIDLTQHPELDTTVADIYRATDVAMGKMLAAMPADADILVVSPAGMSPTSSRSHLLPAMIKAVMAGKPGETVAQGAPASSLLSTVRSIVPTGLRSWIAKMLPDKWAVELATRLELRGIDWSQTQAFMVPNDDAGFVRLNLCGRERDGIVDPRDADALMKDSDRQVSTRSKIPMEHLRSSASFAFLMSESMVPVSHKCRI